MISYLAIASLAGLPAGGYGGLGYTTTQAVQHAGVDAIAGRWTSPPTQTPSEMTVDGGADAAAAPAAARN